MDREPIRVRRRLAALVTVFTGVLVLAACGRGPDAGSSDSGAGPAEAEPAWVRVVVPAELVAGSRFSVSYELRDPATDPRRMHPSVELELWRGDKHLNVLVSSTGEPPGEPLVQPADEAQIPAVLQSGGGPFTFRLPDLPAGTYTLCGGIGLDNTPWERFCRAVAVRRRS